MDSVRLISLELDVDFNDLAWTALEFFLDSADPDIHEFLPWLGEDTDVQLGRAGLSKGVPVLFPFQFCRCQSFWRAASGLKYRGTVATVAIKAWEFVSSEVALPRHLYMEATASSCVKHLPITFEIQEID